MHTKLTTWGLNADAFRALLARAQADPRLTAAEDRVDTYTVRSMGLPDLTGVDVVSNVGVSVAAPLPEAADLFRRACDLDRAPGTPSPSFLLRFRARLSPYGTFSAQIMSSAYVQEGVDHPSVDLGGITGIRPLKDDADALDVLFDACFEAFGVSDVVGTRIGTFPGGEPGLRVVPLDPDRAVIVRPGIGDGPQREDVIRAGRVALTVQHGIPNDVRATVCPVSPEGLVDRALAFSETVVGLGYRALDAWTSASASTPAKYDNLRAALATGPDADRSWEVTFDARGGYSLADVAAPDPALVEVLAPAFRVTDPVEGLVWDGSVSYEGDEALRESDDGPYRLAFELFGPEPEGDVDFVAEEARRQAARDRLGAMLVAWSRNDNIVDPERSR